MASSQFPDSTEARAPNREELIQMAINAAKSGQRDGARVMFRKVLSEDKRNERAMMWLAKLATSKAERKQWLKRILEINPGNSAARNALQKMDYTSSATENRTLLIFGAVAGVLLVLMVVVVIAVSILR